MVSAPHSPPIVVSAPGKLVVCGEYAVVDGSPAVVAAVSVRARATLVPGAGLRVCGNDRRFVEVTEARLQAARDEDEHPLLLAVLRELRARGLPLPAGEVFVDTARFVSAAAPPPGAPPRSASSSAGSSSSVRPPSSPVPPPVPTRKVGLGSSAAAAAAFTAASLVGLDGELPPRALLHDVARAAHRAFQGGGSGIDVAASCHGGLVVFQQGHVHPAPPLPPSLSLVVAFTGVAARTQGFVDAWRGLAARAAHRQAIDRATTQLLAGARDGSARDVLDAIDAARVAMDAMGRAAGIDVVTAEHARIAQVARACGGAAKPSGAGGGDVAACLVPSTERDALERALATEGFEVLDVQLDPDGVRVEP